MDSDFDGLANFDTAMTEEEMQSGELLHREIEKQRQVAMLVTLSNSSDELKDCYRKDPKAYMGALAFGVEAFDHYENLMELLSGSIARLYSVSKEEGISNPDGKLERTIDRALEIMSERNPKHDH